MSEIKMIGPLVEHVPEWTDPDTGEVFEAHDVNVMITEAVGTDGQVYSYKMTMSPFLIHETILETQRGWLRLALENVMREKGVWSDDPA